MDYNLQDIQESIEESEMSENNQKEFAHYTSIDVLEKLIASSNNSDRCMTFWAFDARSTNDRDELQIGYNFVINHIKEFDSCLDNDVSDIYKLSNYEETLLLSSKYRKIPHAYIKGWLYDGIRTPYIISLSKHIDKNHMWNTMYGNLGKGVCLVFDFSQMNYRNTDISINSPLPVIYDNRLGYLPAINTFIEVIFHEYKYYINQVTQQDNIDKIVELKLQALDVLCAFVSSYYKSEKWHTEQEVRIMCTIKRDNTNCVKCHKESGRSYIEVPVPLACLKRIILGPKVDSCIVEKTKTYAMVLKLNPENIYKSNEPLK